MSQLSTMEALDIWYKTSVKASKNLDFDLSPRQASILLHVYLKTHKHTIKSLSDELNISKAAICRAIDKLSILGFVKRKKDKADKRNVFIVRTINGSVFLSDFADIIMTEYDAFASDNKLKKNSKNVATA